MCSSDLIRDDEGVLGPVTVQRSDGRVQVTVASIQDFPLPDQFPVFGVRFDGRIKSGQFSLDFDEQGGLPESTGSLELVGEGIRAIQPTLRSRAQGNVTLTDANLGTLALEVHLGKRSEMAGFKADRRLSMGDGTVIHVAKAELDGTDIKALVEGQSTIRLFSGKGLGDGQLNLEAAFSFSDPFIERSVKVGGEARKPNAFLRTLLTMDPRWRSAQSGNYWGVVCSGVMSRPVCNPKKPAIRGGDFKTPPKPEPEPEEAAEPAEPTPPPRPMPARPTPSSVPAPAMAPAQPGPAPTLPAPQIAPPARREMPSPVEAPAPIEAAPQAQPPSIDQVNAPMNVRTAPRRPTVIGRARLRGIQAVQEPAAAVEEEEAPAEEEME